MSHCDAGVPVEVKIFLSQKIFSSWGRRSVGQDVVGQNFVGQDVTGAISLGQ